MALFDRKPAAKMATKPFVPAQVVNTGPGRWRVDGHDAARNTRRFFSVEKDAQAFAAKLNSAPKAAAPKPAGPTPLSASKFGGALRGIVDTSAALKAKQAATAKAKADKAAALAAENAKKGAHQFAALHTQQALAALEGLTAISSRDQVVFAIRQAELAKVPEARVTAMLTARGWNAGRLAGMVKGLQADVQKA